jgi:hypothetical protein
VQRVRVDWRLKLSTRLLLKDAEPPECRYR